MTQIRDDKPKILVVDANERNTSLLSNFLATEGYEPMVVTDFGQTDEAITRIETVSFAIIDVDRFDRLVWSFCGKLNEHDVPFIVLSGRQNRSLQRESYEHGATKFIQKPIAKRELRTLVRSILNPSRQ